MSFLKNIFKKKPGGTFFGNLLRKVGGGLTSGILGSGKNMMPAEFDLNGNGKFEDDEVAAWKKYKKDGTMPDLSNIVINSHGEPQDDGSVDSQGGSAWDGFLEGFGDLKDTINGIKPRAEVGVDKGTKWLVIGVAAFIGIAIFSSSRNRR